MLTYEAELKHKARQLRKNMTESERALWSRLRGKQVSGIPFYRQKPIGKYIVDFYGPRAKLVVEVDGSQHKDAEHAKKDKYRDEYFAGVSLRVLRFNSREVLKETDAVVEVIYRVIAEQLNGKSPSIPLCERGTYRE